MRALTICLRKRESGAAHTNKHNGKYGEANELHLH